MILSFINIRKVPGASPSVFQHFPQDLANVNEWKIMFDPSIMLHSGEELRCVFDDN